MDANTSTAEVLVDSHGGRTRAVARLHNCSGRTQIGTGIVEHAETGSNRPTAAAELATARALMDLAEQLFSSVDSASTLPSSWLHP